MSDWGAQLMAVVEPSNRKDILLSRAGVTISLREAVRQNRRMSPDLIAAFRKLLDELEAEQRVLQAGP